jgi:NAD+ kinase
VKTIGIFYRDHVPEAEHMARELVKILTAQHHSAWLSPAPQVSNIQEQLEESDLVLVLGGDGTILHAARLCAPLGIPLLGINFGRVGFLTELEPGEAVAKLPLYLDGDYWLDERAMLTATLEHNEHTEEFLALNDIVLVRGPLPRIVQIKIWVDGYYYNTTVADGMILSTATGSTAYNLAAGGPILHPQVKGSVLTPIAPHLVADRSLILDPGATVRMQIFTGPQGGVLSADGQINRELADGAVVTVTNSRYVTRFLRRRPPTHFYQILNAKLKEDDR